MNPRQAPYICKTLSDGPGEPPGKTAFQVPVARPNMVDPDIALERQVMGFTDTRDDVAGHAAEFKRDLPGCVSDTTGQHILARPPVQEGIASILLSHGQAGIRSRAKKTSRASKISLRSVGKPA